MLQLIDAGGLGDGGGEASSQPSTFGFDSQYSLTLTPAEQARQLAIMAKQHITRSSSATTTGGVDGGGDI